MSMNFQRISPLWETFPGREAQPAAAAKAAEGSVFADVFQSLVNNVRETEDEVAKKEYLLSTGQLDNPASAMIAATKYGMSVDMLIQFRNKALDAYSELTRMGM